MRNIGEKFEFYLVNFIGMYLFAMLQLSQRFWFFQIFTDTEYQDEYQNRQYKVKGKSPIG